MQQANFVSAFNVFFLFVLLLMLFDFFNKIFYVQKERIEYRYFYVTTCPKDFGKWSDGVTRVALDVVRLSGRVLGVSTPDYLCSTPIGLIV